MANVDFPHGFHPAFGEWPTVRFAVGATTSTILTKGDMVTMPASGKVQKSAAGDAIWGCVAQVLNSSASPVLSLAAASGGYADCWVDPGIIYSCQDDGDSATLAQTDVGANFDLVDASGDATIGLSKQELDSSSATTGSAQFKLVEIAPDTSINGNTWADNVEVWVRVNEHSLGAATAGI